MTKAAEIVMLQQQLEHAAAEIVMLQQQLEHAAELAAVKEELLAQKDALIVGDLILLSRRKPHCCHFWSAQQLKAPGCSVVSMDNILGQLRKRERSS
jgi:hypothetical protein